MHRYKKGLFAIVMFALFPVLLFGCSHNPSPGFSGRNQEIWEVILDGQGEGRLKMVIARSSNQDGSFTVTGKLSGSMKDRLGGEGYVDLGLNGKIKGNAFEADLNGQSDMAEGPSPVNGKLEGTLSQSSGSGKWNVIHRLGASSGKYTMERIN